MKSKEQIKLRSGRTCEVIKIQKDLIPNYYIIAFPKIEGQPDSSEVVEMLSIGINKAKHIAIEIVNDEEAYTILYSGYSARREKGWHIHIVLLGNRWKKAWLYFVLTIKNLMQAFGLRKDDSPRLK